MYALYHTPSVAKVSNYTLNQDAKKSLQSDFEHLSSNMNQEYKKLIDLICYNRRGETPLIDMKRVKYTKSVLNGEYTIHGKFLIDLPYGQFEMPDKDWMDLTDYIWFKNYGY